MIVDAADAAPPFALTPAEELRLWQDFETLCDFGGRLSGTDGEARALDWLEGAGAEATGEAAHVIPVPYAGWRATLASVETEDGERLACHPLVRSVAAPPDGLRAEVLDLGRGTLDDFAARRDALRGRIALVRHELMFAAGTVHRRRKYEMAREAGAVGFLIAGPQPGRVVAGSSGREAGDGIPAFGLSPEAASRLAPRDGRLPRATLRLETTEAPAVSRTLLFDVPGQSDEFVVLSAHADGHDLAESAIDNATGVAAALAVARRLAPIAKRARRGLRLAIFSVEEWALTGSARYVANLSERERRAIVLNVNLDSVAGGERLTALTSGFVALEPFLERAARNAGAALRCHRPLMVNSDHANFALAGVPAFRLVAGFDEPQASTRLVLTEADTRELVPRPELVRAARVATAIVREALDAEPDEAASWRTA